MGKHFLSQFILKLNFPRGWEKSRTLGWEKRWTFGGGIFLLMLIVFGMGGIIFFSAESVAESEVIFKKKIIHIDNKKINVEVAESSEEHARGLMFRSTLLDGHGMLFIFPNEKVRHFWMKNTLIPLSIGFFNSNKELIDVQEMEPAGLKSGSMKVVYSSPGPIMYALEMPSQWFRKHRIKHRAQLRL